MGQTRAWGQTGTCRAGWRGVRRSARGAIFLALLAHVVISGAIAETRDRVTAELFNSLRSGTDLENWIHVPGGNAELSILNSGSRLVRSELLVRYAPSGYAAAASATDEAGGAMGRTDILNTDLRRLFARTAFGDILVSAGKTRSSWGAGLAFNAGDIIFGSSSVDFSLRTSDPRTDTAWLTNAEIPFGDFSFVEIIVLPGQVDVSNPVEPVVPGVEKSSVGGRINLAAGNFDLQAGYLYRGDAVAGLGETGHHAYITAEGYVPLNWHISVAARTPLYGWDQTVTEESLLLSAGAYDDVSLPADRTLTWQLELLARPFQSFEPQDGAVSSEYGLFLYPSLGLVPRTGLNFNLSSIVSPVDLSATSTLSASWNIYESLTLLGYLSLATGEDDDLFATAGSAAAGQGGMSVTVGMRYVY